LFPKELSKYLTNYTLYLISTTNWAKPDFVVQ
jgi:hypothetical protein